LSPIHRWVWRDLDRRARKLLRFAETEADGGRQLARAAEVTGDPLLRRLFLRHAQDEARHAELFRGRGRELLEGRASSESRGFDANWLAPGERDRDALQLGPVSEPSLLAFLHLSEKAAAERFALYREMLEDDAGTRAIFADVLRDEEFHMKYTKAQLARVDPVRNRRTLWSARAGRLWRAYLRFASALAGLLGGVVLTAQYYVLLPCFALFAKRAGRRESLGWHAAPAPGKGAMKSQY
jgi:rubrerythrin